VRKTRDADERHRLSGFACSILNFDLGTLNLELRTLSL
jgi:hypothetical protein